MLGISVIKTKKRTVSFFIRSSTLKPSFENMECIIQILLKPYDANVKLRKNNSVSKPVNPSTYQSKVGRLKAAMTTRPDIAQAVNTVRRGDSCWLILLCRIRYGRSKKSDNATLRIAPREMFC